MVREVLFGVAGLGRMGRLHAANLASGCPSAVLAAVFDSSHEIAWQVAEQLGVSVAPSYDDLIDDSSIDAVVIASPTKTHADLALRAARRGKHVFCEKPVSFDRDSTVEVVEALAEAGLKFQVGFHRRFDPNFVAVTERLHRGELGDPYLFRASLRDMAPPELSFLSGSGGFFLDMSIHDLDTARWMVGEIAEVSSYGAALSDARLAEIGDFDNVVIVLRFESGALGVIDNSRVAGYGYECAVEVMGSKATVRVDDPWLHSYEWRTPGLASRPLVETFEQRYPVAYSAELESFARCILDGTHPRVGGDDAIVAYDLACAASESCRLGRPVAVGRRRDSSANGFERSD